MSGGTIAAIFLGILVVGGGIAFFVMRGRGQGQGLPRSSGPQNSSTPPPRSKPKKRGFSIGDFFGDFAGKAAEKFGDKAQDKALDLLGDALFG